MRYDAAMDEWYKQFGHRPTVVYFKLLHQDGEEEIELEEIRYDTIGRNIVSTVMRTVPFKEWVDALAANEIHSVPESQVPFLFHF